MIELLTYGHDAGLFTHQPRVIFDSDTKARTQLFWDANGNLSQASDCDRGFVRFHDWDDENRLRMVVDNTKAGYYGYDANGERVYKLTGTSTMTHVSNSVSNASVLLDDAVLYPNPYVTVTHHGYTKHYYMNEERLATSIGTGGWCFMSPDVISNPGTPHENYLLDVGLSVYHNEYPFEYPKEEAPDLTQNVDINDTYQDELQYECPMRHLLELTVEYDPDMLYYAMHDYCNAQDHETDVFYRHSDHLGSANWITDADGYAIQYMHYLPYGQLLANQAPYLYDERYKFTGKERDEETGYDYFGARFYSSQLLHWISVDPLADKYTWISPYAYTMWNPVKFVDPDGREKKSFFSQTKDQRDNRYFANQYKDDNRLHIFSHGNKKGLVFYNGNSARVIPATSEGALIFSDMLTNGSDASELWNSYLRGENTEPLQVVLHGCYTAIMAEALSKEFPDVYFTGTTEEYHSEGAIELGPYSTYKIFGIIDTDWKKDDGQWNTYKGGELIRVENTPSASPITFDEQNGIQ